MQPTSLSRARSTALCAFVVAAVTTRILPHAPNFTAVPAMALFSGAMFRSRWLAYAAPLLAMLIADLLLCAFIYGMDRMVTTPPMYVATAVTVWLGARLPRSLPGVGAGAVLSTLAFFTITNFALWAFGSLYPRTLGGLGACYVAAIPFATNMLLGTLLYGTGLHVLWQQLERRVPGLAAETR